MAEENGQSYLEKTLEFGINGAPIFKKEERKVFLGELRERVIRAITLDRVNDPASKWEVRRLLTDKRLTKIILNQEVEQKILNEYIKIINQAGISFSLVSSSEYKSEIAILGVSDVAVDVDDIFISEREKGLLAKGVPIEIIRNVGSKLCDECWEMINQKAPEEIVNYEKMNLFDKICGFKCISYKG